LCVPAAPSWFIFKVLVSEQWWEGVHGLFVLSLQQIDFLLIVNIFEVKRPMLVNDVNSKIAVNLSHCSVDALRYYLGHCLVVLFVVEIEILIIITIPDTILFHLSSLRVILLDDRSLEQHIVQIDDGAAIDHEDGMTLSVMDSLLNHPVVELGDALIGQNGCDGVRDILCAEQRLQTMMQIHRSKH